MAWGREGRKKGVREVARTQVEACLRDLRTTIINSLLGCSVYSFTMLLSAIITTLSEKGTPLIGSYGREKESVVEGMVRAR